MPRSIHRLLPVILAVLPAPLFAQTPRAITPNDLAALKTVGAPRISPDGKLVAYTLSTADLTKDRNSARIWMSPVAGGAAIPMTGAGLPGSNPKWSPDGKYLGFTAARNAGESQVWTLNRMGGEAEQLTQIKQGVGDFEWSPDGSRLLLSLSDPKPDKPKGDSTKPDTPDPVVVDRLQFKRDFTGYLDRRRTHLYVFEVATKKLTQITSGDFEDSDPAWSPDGKLVAFSQQPHRRARQQPQRRHLDRRRGQYRQGSDPPPPHHQSRLRRFAGLEPRRQEHRLHHRHRRAGDVVRRPVPRGDPRGGRHSGAADQVAGPERIRPALFPRRQGHLFPPRGQRRIPPRPDPRGRRGGDPGGRRIPERGRLRPRARTAGSRSGSRRPPFRPSCSR